MTQSFLSRRATFAATTCGYRHTLASWADATFVLQRDDTGGFAPDAAGTRTSPPMREKLYIQVQLPTGTTRALVPRSASATLGGKIGNKRRTCIEDEPISVRGCGRATPLRLRSARFCAHDQSAQTRSALHITSAGAVGNGNGFGWDSHHSMYLCRQYVSG